MPIFAPEMQKVPSIFQKPIFVKPVWQSIFTAILTILVFIGVEHSAFATLTGFAVVITISITSINIQAPIQKRLNIMLITILVYVVHIFLGYLAGRNPWFIVPAFVGVAWVFAKVRYRIPELWGDINLPAGLSIYMAYQHETLWDIEAITIIMGLGITLLHLIFNILHPKTIFKPKKHKTHSSSTNVLGLNDMLTTYFVQLSILLSIGGLIFYFADFPHAYWLPFTIMIVLQVNHTTTLKRIKDRFIGTVTGCILGGLILVWHPIYELMVILLFLSLFFFSYFVRTNYKIAVIFVTVFVLLLLGYHYKDTFLIVFERLGFTLIGGSLALISSFIFLKNKQY